MGENATNCEHPSFFYAGTIVHGGFQWALRECAGCGRVTRDGVPIAAVTDEGDAT